jgi:ferredoxin-like protein FixX
MEQKMSMKLSTNFIDACFKDCITSYKDDNLSASEKGCLNNCAKRVAMTMQATGEIKPPQDF